MTSNIEHDNGATIFRHACKMGLEGIVSKRKDSPYRSGRSPDRFR
jgi:bifunctional non-homologous end joining protein LigD